MTQDMGEALSTLAHGLVLFYNDLCAEGLEPGLAADMAVKYMAALGTAQHKGGDIMQNAGLWANTKKTGAA